MEDVVKLDWLENGIALVTMEDRDSKNRSSERLLQGIDTVFEEIGKNSKAKTVVVTGYGNYFCCGGDRESLQLIASQRAKYTDFGFFDQLLRCDLPVIAAMQGHAIGAGLVFGAYADIIVLAEESIYSANFLHLGIPPGVGSTWIIPRKFGSILGWEMLFTAGSYYGSELRLRGVPCRFAKRIDVLSLALSLAREIADKPAIALRQVKSGFYESVRQELAAAMERELHTHNVVLPDPEIRQRIQNLYQD